MLFLLPVRTLLPPLPDAGYTEQAALRLLGLVSYAGEMSSRPMQNDLKANDTAALAELSGPDPERSGACAVLCIADFCRS